jgi:glycosyltransferase involved in cell wall biosynthesis
MKKTYIKMNQKNNIPVLAIIVPCYNEEPVLSDTAKQLNDVVERLIKNRKINNKSYIYFVDDGSNDGTWNIIQDLHSKDNIRYKGLKLSRNVGHQNALMAGLEKVSDRADCAISIDADLEDDISVIETMIDRFEEGYEIIYGVRKKREGDSLFKKYSAILFYKLMSFFGVDIVYNHADYRLLSRKAIKNLTSYKEVNLFLRAIIPLIGLKSTRVYYDRKKRLAGVSKYPLRKMISFALDGITSFSITPLRFITILGFIIFIGSCILSIWALSLALLNKSIPGWASTVLPIYFIGGVQLLSIGILGEYLGKIYKEVKSRPRYFKEEELF